MPEVLPTSTSISADDLFRLIGTGHAPLVIDVCLPDDFAEDPRRIPSSITIPFADAADGHIHDPGGRRVVVACHKGKKLSEGVAAHLRHRGIPACTLQGGRVGWAAADLPMVPAGIVPPPRADGSTLWVTRARPKIDGVACPWLIRRFVDPHAVVLFVAPEEVLGVAERFGATPFDIENVAFSRRGEGSTFDTMIDAFALTTPALRCLARIVRGADTARLETVPEAAGLLAFSLGLSHRFHDDIEQTESGLALYDALYLWCRDGRGETHNWPSKAAGA
ncbi:chromate resistance protein ChrB domain-containing protein [Tepidamorphus sp. 3E244]|uniref:chromate resistance protein ChrB domain-containing protein n=1 Tax=Tepidamorphus sp. 3E244 TaxID=3385498 RepID=UPI0038FD1C63